ncbi:hypothetical protein T11_17177 [Trichinella zimbabwensis]|uniref:Uncharacterized protein n=1 Tax=Trichinella zimbabwensis TaxID=268475 RepID=A0A0V1GF34_9BILA|nr:hypothetical protein T11_17177 [Trichinella zimbabwensis]
MDSRPNLKKLVSGELRILPPLAVTQDTTTAGPGGLKVTIYSKGEKSRYDCTVNFHHRDLRFKIKALAKTNTLKSYNEKVAEVHKSCKT